MGMRSLAAGTVLLDGADITDAGARDDPRGRHRLHPRGPAPARAAAGGAAVGEPDPRPPDPAAQREGPADRPRRRPRPTPSGSCGSTTSAPPSILVTAASLSGGNQQKLIVGREMSDQPRVLLAAHPTRGVDVGAQAAIWDLISAARRKGLAVLLISADLDELIGLSDTLRVILRGRLVGEFDPDLVTPEQLGSAMTGADGGDAAMKVDPRKLGLALAAPALAVVVALLVTTAILLAAGDPVVAVLGGAVPRTPAPAGGSHRQRGDGALPVGRRGGDRLPDEPVQHRRRRPVPDRLLRRRRLRRRRTSCPAG